MNKIYASTPGPSADREGGNNVCPPPMGISCNDLQPCISSLTRCRCGEKHIISVQCINQCCICKCGWET